jgi:NAD(P)-dependent dehydrogenase (short-subunit alcohol dehydrogenase family)
MSNPTKSLRVFITGGCGDIGRAIARRFVSAGGRVVVADILPDAQGAAKAREIDPGKVHYISCDVTSSTSVNAAVEQAAAKLGGLDVAISNAGAAANGKILELSQEFWQRNIDMYLTASFLVAQSAAKVILRNPRGPGGHRGSLLFTGTWIQSVPWAGSGAYSAAKAGQEMLMKVMAQELAAEGITCNVVAPGLVDAGLTKKTYEINETFRRQIPGAVPLGRMSTVDEVAGAFYFLAGPEGVYITGTTILVDGGASLFVREA